MELHLPLIFTLIVLFWFMIVTRFRSKHENRKSKLPPGPWKLPLIGNLHQLLGPLPHHILRDLAKKHGPLMFLQLGEVPTIIASSPKVAKEILKTNEIVFADRGSLFAGNIFTYGSIGITLSPYGGHWKHLKKISTLELLSAKKVQSFMSVREEEVANCIEDLSSLAGSSVNITEKIFLLTNDIICRTAFGKKIKERERFDALVLEVIELCSGFEIADLLPSYKFLHGISGMKHRSMEAHQEIDKMLNDILNDHKLNRDGELEEDLIDVLIQLQDKTDREFPIEDNCIKAIIFEVFFAGSDTSSKTLEWAFSELVRHPSVMKKAQSEVRRIFHGKTKVTQSDVNELSYLKLVIKETLRLHPPNPLLLPRESREGCEISGYEIPKGTKVLTNVWAIGRDPEYWSDDAETFKPERFQDISIDYKGADFEFIPFGAGTRMCPGVSFASANMEYPLAQLLYHFDWKLPDGTKPEELDMTELFGGTVGRKYNLRLVPTPCSVFN